MKLFCCLFTIMLLLTGSCFAQDSAGGVFHIQALPPEGILLNQGWKFHSGDSMAWTNADFDDRTWQAIDPTQDIRDLEPLLNYSVGWFRLRFSVDSARQGEPLAALIQQTGASEIYLNGKLIHRLGKVSSHPEEVSAQTLATNQMIAFPLDKRPTQVLAIRFAVEKGIPYYRFAGRPNPGLQIVVNEVSAASNFINANDITSFVFFRAGVFFILALIHLGFFWYYPLQKANLYFFIYAFLYSLSEITHLQAYKVYLVETKMYLLIFGMTFAIIGNIFYLLALYQLIKLRKEIIFWVLFVVACLVVPLTFWFYFHSFEIVSAYLITILIESVRITIIANKRRTRGAKILAVGAVCACTFFIIFWAMAHKLLPAGPNWIIGYWDFSLYVLSLPVSISLFLALEFAYTSQSLETKLVEVQQLSEKTIAQEQEKQQLLATENERLEQQVSERTIELIHQKEELQSTLEHLKATQAQLIQSEKMASLGELTAGIAHEIQNPLNFVNNFSEINQELFDELEQEINKGDLEEARAIVADLKENEQKIHHHGKRADSIVKGMLQHSRSSGGERQLTDINALADEYLRLSYHGLRAKEKDFNADFKLEADPAVGKIEVVPQEIGRVLLNLFNNAFYAVSQKKAQLNGQYQPQVTVKTMALHDKVEVRVRDNGTGIPESVQQKIFQPFFTTKPAGEGTGLGLSLSYDIITKGHSGDLKVESKEDEYTEFIIGLPIK